MSRFTSVKSLGLFLAAATFFLTASPAILAQSEDSTAVGSDSARALVTMPVDAGQKVPLSGSLLPAVAASRDLGVLDADQKISGVQVVLRRSKEQQQALQQLLGRTTNAKDPLFGTTVPAAEFAETFGIAKADVDAVTGWLVGNGLHVDEVKFGGRVLVVSGRSMDFESAFDTQLHNFAAGDGKEYIANNSELKVPAALKHSIVQTLGLQTFAVAPAVAYDGPHASGIKPDLSQTSYAAPSTTVGSTSATQTVTFTFTATTTTLTSVAVLTQGAASLDFAQVGGTCAAGLYLKAVTPSCTVTFNFKPKYPGQRLGAIELVNAGTVVMTAFINGVGLSGQGEFPGGTLTTISTSSTPLNLPRGVSTDSSGNVYIADSGSGNVYKYAGGVAGTPLTLATGLSGPVATVVDGAGNVYVSAQNSGAIYEIAGGATATTTQTATKVATINFPDDSLLVDGAGNVYFASSPNSSADPNCPSQINVMAAGTHTLTTLIAANSAIPGLTGAVLGRLIGEAIDYNGNLFFTDFMYNRIYKLASGASALTVLVNADGFLNNPHAIAVDNAGNLYVTNYDGNPYLLRYGYDGGSTLTESTFPTAVSSVGITIDGAGNFFLLTGSTSSNGALYKFTRDSNPSLVFPSTQVGAVSAPIAEGFENDGNATLTISSYAGVNAAFSSATSGTTTPNCASSGTLVSGGVCNLEVEFVPTTIGTPLTGTATVTDNTLAVSGATQVIQISGPSTGATTSLFSVAGIPPSVVYGSGTTVQYFAFVQGLTGEPAPTGTVVLSGPTLTGGPFTETISSANCATNATGPYCGVSSAALGIGTTTPGSYTITATYSGDTHYAGSTGTGTEVVTGSPVTLGTITATPSSVTDGSSTAVVLSETVSYSGSTVPAGPLKFTLNGVTYTATCTGSSSPLTCSATVPAATVAALPVGSYAITSTETASGNYASATGSGTFTVNKATAVFGTLSISPASVTYGSSTTVVLSDTLSYTGNAVPTGAVTYPLNGTTYTATCTGSSSPLTCAVTVPAATVASIAVGTYTVTPAFAGDTTYNTASGTAGSFSVTNQTPVLNTITVTPSSVGYGSSTSVGLSETVSYTGTTAPSGALTFTVNGVTYPATCSGSSSPLTCTATVPAATVAGLAVNSYPVTSAYTAAGGYNSATGSGTFTVGKGTATFGTMTFSPTSIQYGASAAVTITDTLSYLGKVAPTGAVTFVVDGYTFTATCTGSSSPLTCSATAPTGTVAQAAIGSYTVTPNFAGDSNYNPSTGTAGSFSVTVQTPVLSTITVTPASVAYGSSTAVVISETVSYQGTTGPAGPLTFTLNGVNYTATCTGSSSPLTCTATVPAATVAALAVNTYAVTSTETASGSFASATGSGGSLQVTTGTPTFGTVTFSPVSTVPYGTSQVITISVPLSYSGTVAPTGTVTFSGDGNTFTATCTGSSSPLTCTGTIPANTVHIANVGVYPITPSITAGGSYGTSSGSSSNFTVTKGNITFGATTTLSPAGSEPYATSQAVTFTDSLSYLGVLAPTGTVSVTIGGTSYNATCTGSSSPLACSYTLPAATVAGLAAGSYAITWNDTTDSNYLAVSLAQTNSFVISQAPGGLSLVAATPGTTTTGVTSTLLTATMAPALSGVTVTFTDATTGVVLGTGVTNGSGVATLTISTSTTGVAAGMNNFTASYAATSNYSAAVSTASTVYLSGILLTVDAYHDFSTNPGTYDGAPVCNGSNGTAGSTCTGSFGVVVTNFTTSTQVVTETFTNSASRAFTSATNCPVAGLASGKTCNIVFYYNPPYGDGCSLTTNCTTPAGQSGPEGTFEQATWSIGATGQITGIGDKAFDRAGATSFPAQLVGKALIAPGNSLAMTPQTLTFGPQAIGTVPATQNIFVTNTGSSSQSVTYSLPASPFTTINNCGAVLAAGTTCEIQVSYTSSSVGSSSGSVVATPEVGNAITALVSGTTSLNGGLALTTNAHSYGSVTDGSSTTFGLGIKNNATTAATLSFTDAATAGYSFSNTCPNPLPAGASCQVSVTFAPTAPGTANFALTVHSNVFILPGGTGSGSTFTDVVSFTGVGVAGGTLTATSTAHNFGTLPVGSEATAYGVELSNNTAVPLTMTMGGGTFASNGAADGFTMQTNCPATLAVNANCEVVFAYTPKAVGTTSVAYPISASGGGTTYTMSSGGTTVSSISLSGTGE